ncbi:hypothetical protein BLOT_006427 [Blomia tropicalis]|nr:hypothetical protein BLOT_006427 [Blomia tropicalis]
MSPNNTTPEQFVQPYTTNWGTAALLSSYMQQFWNGGNAFFAPNPYEWEQYLKEQQLASSEPTIRTKSISKR